MVLHTMRMVATLVCVVLGAGCAGKKSDRRGTGESSAGDNKRTMLTKKQLRGMLSTRVPGYSNLPGAAINDTVFPIASLRYLAEKKTPAGARAYVYVALYNCADDRGQAPGSAKTVPQTCRKIDAALWKKRKKRAMAWLMLSKKHMENPDLDFEISTMKLGRKKGIAIYQRSSVRVGVKVEQLRRLSVYHNDGLNQVEIHVMDKQGRGLRPEPSLDPPPKRLSRKEMAAVARSFWAVFGPQIF